MYKWHRHKTLLLTTFILIMSLTAVAVLSGITGASPANITNTQQTVITIAEANWRSVGTQASSQYGEAVRSAGDVNCDGFDDAIVGAMTYDQPGYADAGRAYLFYGSAAGLSETPDRIIEPPVLNGSGFFGGMATTAGDVNNDNCDDVMVSMVNYDGGQADEGAVFVWYGSETGLESAPDWKAEGEATFAHLGWDIGPAGDVNGDGYDDIIAGALQYNGGAISHAYVWYGSIDGLHGGVDGTPANADWSATTDQHCNTGSGCSGFGSRVGTAGDVNGDEIDDVFIGAPSYDKGQDNEGVVFIWYGTQDDGPNGGVSGTPANADWLAESNQAGAKLSGDYNYMNCGVGTAGDVNGDGFDDFIIGSYTYNAGESGEGAVFVWLGSESGLNEGVNGTPDNAHWMGEADQESAQFGFVVSTAGDFNRDGYDDVVIGARAYDITATPTITNAGALFMWFGGSQGLGEDGSPANADWMAGSDQKDSLFGYSVDLLGDINGDGAGDVIGGAAYYDVIPAQNEGAAFAFYGFRTLYLPLIIK